MYSNSANRTQRGSSNIQVPNPINHNLQNSNDQNFWLLKIGIWNLFGIWDLGFGISVLRTAALPHSEIPGSKPAHQLPEAYRRSPRPSSLARVKASTIRPL